MHSQTGQTPRTFCQLFKQAGSKPEWQLQSMLLDVACSLNTLMRDRGVTVGELATRLSVGIGPIRTILRGETDADLVLAFRAIQDLGGRVSVSVTDASGRDLFGTRQKAAA